MTGLRDLTVPFIDILAPDFVADALEVHAARSRCWRAETPVGPAVLHHEDVWTLLRDRRLGQGSAVHLDLQGVPDGPLRRWWDGMILNLHGPTHDRLRRLLLPAFRPAVIDALRPRMRRHITELLVAVPVRGDCGECDAVGALADPYPVAVLADLLGIEEAIRPQVRKWTAALGLAFTFEVMNHLDAIDAAVDGLYGVAETLIVNARTDPGEDVVSDLVAASDDGDRLDGDELRSIIVALLFGGHDTTKHQLALALHLFARDSSAWERLAADPALVPAAVDEVLRVAPTTPVIYRVAHEDVVHRDLAIPAGTFLTLFVSAANTDPAVGAGTRFDLTGEARRHLTFGGGIHHCIGHLLARAELEEALTVLTASITDLRICGPITWRPATGICGPVTLPLAFRPRPRR